MCKKIISWLFTLLQDIQLTFYLMNRLKYVHLLNDNSRCSNYNFTNEIWLPLGYHTLCHHHSYMYVSHICLWFHLLYQARRQSSYFGEKIGRSLIFTFRLSTTLSVLLKWHAFNKIFPFPQKSQMAVNHNY